MVDFVDLQYATQLSSRLDQFKIKSTSPYRFNFRCPVCGDSQKSKIKARGWLIEDVKDQSLHFYCHNCGASHNFHGFLKVVDPAAHSQYIASKFIDGSKRTPSPEVPDEQFKTDTKQFVSNPLRTLKKVSQLRHDHPVKQYIDKRQIPSKQHYRLYYAPKFMQWINTILPGKFPDVSKDHPRLILPFVDKSGKCFGVSARGFDPKGLRYITIMFDNKPKLFGLDAVDFDSPYYVLEGSIDSLFLDNALAMAGADGNVVGLPNLYHATFVFDNEPRNKEIHKRIEKLIASGRSVCIWPSHIMQKDVNDMVLAGMTPDQITYTIRSNTYKGLQASLALTKWRKT